MNLSLWCLAQTVSLHQILIRSQICVLVNLKFLLELQDKLKPDCYKIPYASVLNEANIKLGGLLTQMLIYSLSGTHPVQI